MIHDLSDDARGHVTAKFETAFAVLSVVVDKQGAQGPFTLGTAAVNIVLACWLLSIASTVRYQMAGGTDPANDLMRNQ